MNEWIDADTRAERAHEMYEQGRWAEAAAELRAAIDMNPYNPSWHFNLGLTLEAMEEYTRAIDSYHAALKIDENDLEVRNCLGSCLTRLGKYAEALEEFRRIERANPHYEPSYCNRIVTYSEMGQHDQAEVMFYLARQIVDECPHCYYNIGNSLYIRRQYDHAIHCWQQTLRLDSGHPQVNARIGDAYWAKGDLAEARQCYERELAMDSHDTETLLDLGELLIEMKEIPAAEGMLQRVLRESPDSAAAHFLLGELAMEQEKYTAAEEQYRLVMRIDRKYPCVNAHLAKVLMRRGDVKTALKHLLSELKICGDDPETLQELGQLFLEAQHTHVANYVLRRLVKLEPDDACAHHNLAVSFFMMDRLEDGIRHCRKALKLQPEYALALYNLSLAHLQKGQVMRARRYAARAMTLTPDNVTICDLSRRLGLMGFWTRLRLRLTPRRRRSDILGKLI